MTLSVSPAWNWVIETTTASSGSTARDAIDWTAVTMCAPTSTGSTVVCGQAACPPRPSMVMSMRSADAISAPGRMANAPTGRPG